MASAKLHLRLIVLYVSLVPLLAVAAAGAWLAATGALADHTWQLAGAALAALLVAALTATMFARRVASAMTTLDATAKATAATLRAREAAWHASDRAKDDFAAMLGHELRNPLGTLAAAAHVLRTVVPSQGPAKQASDTVLRQIEQMTRLVEDLLDLNRVARGKVSLNRQPLDLRAAVEAALRELGAAGRLEKHVVETEMSAAWVRADEARIQQIVVNLVGNALKYTPEGGKVTVALRRDRDNAVLRVRDSGVGMSPELAAHAFELFVQGDSAGERAPGGLGIGLALVKRLAELHGGSAFAASSGPGAGSVFTVVLPAIEARPDDTQPSAAAQERPRHRILLIEDNEPALRAMQAALEIEGHQVYAAANGSAGLDQASAVAPDVAVIDIRLPGMSGYEIAEALRRDEQRRAMVLIALTGYGQPDSLRRAQEAGFDQYVTKPITPDRLVRLIDVACAARARHH
jgi:signal transduction histidine kinase/CheY-like chemotaxis protein